MPMKTIVAWGILAAGIASTIFLAGAMWYQNKMLMEPDEHSFTIVERPIPIPPSGGTTSTSAQPADDNRSRTIDSLLIELARKDSTEGYLRDKLGIRYATRQDSIRHKDSTGSFRVDIMRKMSYDPLSDTMRDSTIYTNAMLTTVKELVTKFVPLSPEWTEIAAWTTGLTGLILLILAVTGVI